METNTAKIRALSGPISSIIGQKNHKTIHRIRQVLNANAGPATRILDRFGCVEIETESADLTCRMPVLILVPPHHLRGPCRETKSSLPDIVLPTGGATNPTKEKTCLL